MKAYRWSRGITPLILNLGTRWVEVVSRVGVVFQAGLDVLEKGKCLAPTSV